MVECVAGIGAGACTASSSSRCVSNSSNSIDTAPARWRKRASVARLRRAGTIADKRAVSGNPIPVPLARRRAASACACAQRQQDTDHARTADRDAGVAQRRRVSGQAGRRPRRSAAVGGPDGVDDHGPDAGGRHFRGKQYRLAARSAIGSGVAKRADEAKVVRHAIDLGFEGRHAQLQEALRQQAHGEPPRKRPAPTYRESGGAPRRQPEHHHARPLMARTQQQRDHAGMAVIRDDHIDAPGARRAGAGKYHVVPMARQQSAGMAHHEGRSATGGDQYPQRPARFDTARLHQVERQAGFQGWPVATAGRLLKYSSMASRSVSFIARRASNGMAGSTVLPSGRLPLRIMARNCSLVR